MRTLRYRPLVCVLTVMAGLALAGSGPAFGAASVVIWPINPAIEAGARATALWLENRGTGPVTLQVRVLGWEQAELTDRYRDDQQDVIASPPMATIAPGRRQLVRLTRATTSGAGTETAYRVLIDEVPVREHAGTASAPVAAMMGVQFRMRYSVPLFTYAAGRRAGEAADGGTASALTWWIVNAADGRFLHVRNSGDLHARLTDVRVKSASVSSVVGAGLLGYVLPGAEMRWPLADDAPRDGALDLEASVNGALPAALRH